MDTDTKILWDPASVSLHLNQEDVHLWCADLDSTPDRCQRMSLFLSADERVRAKNFYFERDQNRFIVGRALLRILLGSYVGMEPNELKFNYSSRGKPILESGNLRTSVQFNLAHSGGLVLLGFTRNIPIGVDIEVVRPISELKEIAQRFFSTGEVERFLSVPDDQKQEAFLNCWTRKEAFLKATGDGITEFLDQFEVSLIPGEAAALLESRIDGHSASDWFLHHLQPAANCIAAVAVRNSGMKIHCWQWRESI